MLASLESKAKDSLERVIEQKNDLVALKAEVSSVLCLCILSDGCLPPLPPPSHR
jgi:hypothetical protein